MLKNENQDKILKENKKQMKWHGAFTTAGLNSLNGLIQRKQELIILTENSYMLLDKQKKTYIIRGDGHLHPEKRGGAPVSKKFFSAPRASVWSNNKGGGGPPGPLPWSRTDNVTVLLFKMLYIVSKNKFVTWAIIISFQIVFLLFRFLFLSVLKRGGL